jgi:hypothetical protein
MSEVNIFFYHLQLRILESSSVKVYSLFKTHLSWRNPMGTQYDYNNINDIILVSLTQQCH